MFNWRVLTRRPALVLALAFVAALINLPLLHHVWTDYRLDTSGVATDADVVEVEAIPPDAPDQQYLVTFRLPRDADPERREFVAEVGRTAYDGARSRGTVAVEYLPGSPQAHRVEGAVTRRLGLWMTLLGDAALLVMAGLVLRFGRRTDGLTLIAGEDLVRCRPGGAVEQVGSDEYVVRGDVLRMSDGEVVLDVGQGREVRVLLGAFRNPAGYQQPVEARGRAMPGLT